MLQPDVLPNYKWRQLHERLDRAIAETAMLYLQRLANRRIPIRPTAWNDEIDELRLGREPNYDMPGVPLGYALRYMPRRVISVLGSLMHVLDERYPMSVLDVGSGTGATTLALELLEVPKAIHVRGLEASREMIAFAECLRLRAGVSPRYNDPHSMTWRRMTCFSNLISWSSSPRAFPMALMTGDG